MSSNPVDRAALKAAVVAALQQHLASAEVAATKPANVMPEAGTIPAAPRGRPLITEADVMQARSGNRRIQTTPDAIITPLARESAERYGVALVFCDKPSSAPSQTAPASAAITAPAASSAAQQVVAIASDHGGFALKQALVVFLEREAGCRVLDLGTTSAAPVDYADFAHKLAAAVARGEASCGICIDGMGLGSAMAANRHSGVRAAACREVLEVVNAREHNDANVLCLGGRVLGDLTAKALVSVFLATPFAGGRHAARVQKIEAGPC